ncbi:MAG: DUF1289 domain-containing protein [Pseudomonadales bacterium]
MDSVEDRLRVESPCVKICALSEGQCLGCGRSVEEIKGWPFASNAERQRILDRIKNEFLTG